VRLGRTIIVVGDQRVRAWARAGEAARLAGGSELAGEPVSFRGGGWGAGTSAAASAVLDAVAAVAARGSPAGPGDPSGAGTSASADPGPDRSRCADCATILAGDAHGLPPDASRCVAAGALLGFPFLLVPWPPDAASSPLRLVNVTVCLPGPGADRQAAAWSVPAECWGVVATAPGAAVSTEAAAPDDAAGSGLGAAACLGLRGAAPTPLAAELLALAAVRVRCVDVPGLMI